MRAIAESFPKALRERREDLGFTQKALADKAGISARALDTYEEGKRLPPLDQAYALSQALDIHLFELMGVGFTDPEGRPLSENPTIRRYEMDLKSMQQSLEKLRTSERRWRRLASVNVEGVIMHDGITVLDINPQLIELFGYSREDFVGKSILSFVHMESMDTVRKAIDEGRTDAFGIFVNTPSGQKMRVTVQTKRLPDGTRIATFKRVPLESMSSGT